MNKWCGCLLLLMFIGCGNPGGDVDIAEPNQLGEADETPFLMVPVVPNDLFPYLSVETFSGKNYPGRDTLGHNDEHVYAIGRNAVVYYAPIGSVDLKELERTLADQKREREKFMGSWTEDTIIANGVAPPREFWKWLEEASLVKEVPKRGE